MKYSEYAIWTRTLAQYPQSHSITYPAIGVMNEVGEFMGKVKKQIRGDRLMTANELLDELCDVLWYVARTMDDAELPLADDIQYESSAEAKELMVNPDFIVVQGLIMMQFAGDLAALMETTGMQFVALHDNAKLFQICLGILTSLLLASEALGSSLDDLIKRNVAKLEDRKARGVVKGDGDNR